MAAGKQTTPIEDNTATKWLILPFLNDSVVEFISLYKSFANNHSKKIPIMIMGDPGVGKSLFVHIYRKLYEEDHSGAKSVRINVAAIPKNLIESELFGYEKGAFTGADRDTPGLVETAKLLILEEIGELPKSVQAKLLTFIEDGYYYRVGGREEKQAKDIQIISTTNKKAGDFRQDFFNRFFIFPVPALHKRRVDVLYYLYTKVPHFFEKLKPREILSLLAYNWPGNMREVDHLIQEAYWKENNYFDQATKSNVVLPGNKYDSNPFFSHYPYAHSSINFHKPIELYATMKEAGINADLADSILNKYGLGISRKEIKKKFLIEKTIRKPTKKELLFDKSFDTQSIFEDSLFNSPFDGLSRFGALFNQLIDADKDLLDILPNTINEHFIISHTTTEAGMDPEIKLSHEIAVFLQGTKQSDPALDILNMQEKELLDYYRQALIDRCGGNKAEAARRAAVPYQTSISRLNNI